jgi:Tfp pilus assembly protein PilF/TolB-like protein
MKIGFLFLGLLLGGCASVPQTSSVVPLAQALQNLAVAIDNGLVEKKEALTVSTFQDLNKANAAKTQVFATYVSDQLLSTLKSTFPDLDVVDRGDIDKILLERTYSSEGVPTNAKMANLGALTPARYIVTGDFTIFPSTVNLEVKLLDIRDGSILLTQDETVTADADVRSLLGGTLPAPEVVAPASPANLQAVSYLQLGVRQESGHDDEAALRSYNQAVHENPAFYQAYLRRGELLLHLHRWGEARADFWVAIHHLPRQTASWMGLAHAEAGAGNWGAAEGTWRQTISRFPRDWWVWRNYGIFLMNSHRPEAALNAFNRSVTLHPFGNDSALYRVRVLRTLGRNEQARRDYQQAVEQARRTHNERWLKELEAHRAEFFD